MGKGGWGLVARVLITGIIMYFFVTERWACYHGEPGVMTLILNIL